MASSPCSPVRTRSTASSGAFQILPSPIFPVRAVSAMRSLTASCCPDSTMTSMRTLGTKSIVYSEPRNVSVLPPWRP